MVAGIEICCETIDSLMETLQPTNSIWQGSSFEQLAFRGQANAAWGLVPRAFREGEILGYSASAAKPPLQNISEQSRAEYAATLAFVNRADSIGLELPGDLFEFRSLEHLSPVEANDFWKNKWPQASDLELLAIAQHHGVPTRLIDFTYHGPTALFFGALGAINSYRKKNGPKHFAVWAIDLRFIRYIWNRPTVKERIREIVIPRSGNRFLHAQQGLFLLDAGVGLNWADGTHLGLETVVEERVEYWSKRPGAWPNGQPKYVLPFVKIVVPAKLSKAVLRLLHDQGVNGSSIMPSHDQVVKALEFMRKNKFPTG